MDLFSDQSAVDESLMPVVLPDNNGYGSRWHPEKNGHEITVPDGSLFYARRFFPEKLSDRCMQYFLENDSEGWSEDSWQHPAEPDPAEVEFKNIAWKQESIRFYGRISPLPRLTSWYGDEGVSYTYSGITQRPNPWNKGLLHIKRLVEQSAGVQFNSVLLNWYRGGDDYLNWHADDEKALGKDPIIASANFGATRDFVLRRMDDKATKITLPLGHGTLLIMSGSLQHFWEHSVPKRKRVLEGRVNLTFRRTAGE